MFEALNTLLDKNSPFVVFKHPNSKEVHIYFQEDNKLHLTQNFSEKGFLMAPFANTDFYSFIPKKQNKIYNLSDDKSIFKTDFIIKDENKEPFISLVESALKEFKNNKIQKVVLSRELKINVSNKNSIQTFQNLTQLYSNAFVYYWHHPKTGSWMGATPERFINLSDSKLHTIALAGTSIMEEEEENPLWTDKEIEEQKLVTDSINNSLQSLFPDEKINVGNVSSYPVGALWHLKTDITVDSSNLRLSKIIKALHPTPAVGGFPKISSIKFILKNEKHKRKFYTGFLGLFESNSKADLYVNLRCAEVTNSGYTVYVGAGITSQSDPTSEWEETKHKAMTFSKAL